MFQSIELDHSKKGLINIQNIDDNECFKWSIVRYLNPPNHHPERITKVDQGFAEKLDFKDIKFPVKIRDINKIEKKKKKTKKKKKKKKKKSISISVFGYENKEKHPIYVSKYCCEETHVDLLLIGEEGKRHYVVIKDFNTFMYDPTLII